uniref:RNA polymerase II elongation factor ELL N-terminal domain-containing protein n=1 Tax=Scophthalmus maximus TaxID=52904 RepID=A0A8D3BN32_SCOMX
MASLGQEQRYGLCCGTSGRTGPGATLYHVKLTDTAVKALEAYQQLKGSLPNEPSICFKGNQGVSVSHCIAICSCYSCSAY